MSIAKNYLAKGSTFRVLAEIPGDSARESDLAGAASSRLLDEFRGTRVDDRSPKVTFRAVVDSSVAVIGVEVRQGVGGAPTSKQSRASCLVSGGMHSSVVSWMAARAGYSVSLLHVFESSESLREVAKLYAELSHRMDPRALNFDVLFPEESTNLRRIFLAWFGGASRQILFSGAHAECRNARFLAGVKVSSPLFLMSEEGFRTVHRSLGLQGYTGRLGPLQARHGSGDKFRVKSFGGERADAHRVLDTLLK